MHTIMEGVSTHTREATLLKTSEKSAIPEYVELEECGVSGGVRVWGCEEEGRDVGERKGGSVARWG